ncbi:hypothetical protein GOARA_088_00270 [Gordonia araii NBRC 100433]|uniref:DUF3592 domain-containing protein n=1 Tax=Gordonia araii NBRC 100433 TaxID=1073574 RepID=G7H7D9_9ACTN|nr:hypothetical protein [Gordonia araii]NNG98447.1 hypothetical protein [Gordonia araii NBRC 100433]GAB11764.1 hypothetical protein GOARA_088_00270 [Gordonia araii NBRC 100433]
MSLTAQRIVQIALLVVATILTVMALFLFMGCVKNDRQINANKATAVAEVSSADRLHAAVGFFTPDGKFHSPRLGLLYPTELSVGERISVDYDASNPDGLARPTGRSAVLAVIPTMSMVLAVWAVVGAMMLLIAELGRRTRTIEDESASAPA